LNNSKILITGVGSITAAGNTNHLWEAVVQGNNCLTFLEDNDMPDSPDIIVGRVADDLSDKLPNRVNRFISRHALLGYAAFQECLSNSGLDRLDSPENGLVFGSASLGQDMMKRTYHEVFSKKFKDADYNVLNTISNAGAAQIIASVANLKGFVQGVEGASCTGILSFINAVNLIQSGICKRVFCIVGDANLYPSTMLYYTRRIRSQGKSFSFFGIKKSSEKGAVEDYILPFSDSENGDRGAIAEAGVAVLLESEEAARERNANIHGELSQPYFCFHADNYHGTDRYMVGLNRVFSQISEEKIDSAYLSITGCYPLDASTLSICSRFYPGIHAFSAEAVIGHTGAASSLINVILASMSIQKGVLLPTRNYKHKIKNPHCKLTPRNEFVQVDNLKSILIASTGFGGYNGVCCIKKYE
jgi:3-oxoacyl-[acyl-carrier-protein] synthase II